MQLQGSRPSAPGDTGGAVSSQGRGRAEHETKAPFFLGQRGACVSPSGTLVLGPWALRFWGCRFHGPRCPGRRLCAQPSCRSPTSEDQLTPGGFLLVPQPESQRLSGPQQAKLTTRYAGSVEGPRAGPGAGVAGTPGGWSQGITCPAWELACFSWPEEPKAPLGIPRDRLRPEAGKGCV